MRLAVRRRPGAEGRFVHLPGNRHRASASRPDLGTARPVWAVLSVNAVPAIRRAAPVPASDPACSQTAARATALAMRWPQSPSAWCPPPRRRLRLSPRLSGPPVSDRPRRWGPLPLRPLTGVHFQPHRVAEPGEARPAPVLATVLRSGSRDDVAGGLIGEAASIVKPLRGVVPRGVGPLAREGHTVVAEHPVPLRMQGHHGLWVVF